MGASKEALTSAECPVARAVSVVGDRWSVLIVRDVFDGICRFGELQRSLGLSRNILTERLRTLVAQGVLETRPASDGTAYHEYALTKKGSDLFTVLVALRQWGEGHLFAEGEQHSELLEIDGDRPIRKLEPLDMEGRPITYRNAYVRKVSHAN
ncbi:helix-turn-helix domain-containing protein [Nonomuraea roseoviolacea subsp. roseoviolacea]|uniref:DNA-binding HxlR family transcriptional regulator n=1 Tax=Nonomuraea roseoviolacea subsp. carminata TaxID=160689 RepID=A0ABT1KED8_9ACTN|nr:helix-turn-helix domain-containing protein [Nonomuraea roseoviolacea]MCP2352385.1 DNA-binding HxlR family transcriptional regulator [Nonomuraea roseoviolacea subsp. carminata]